MLGTEAKMIEMIIKIIWTHRNLILTHSLPKTIKTLKAAVIIKRKATFLLI